MQNLKFLNNNQLNLLLEALVYGEPLMLNTNYGELVFRVISMARAGCDRLKSTRCDTYALSIILDPDAKQPNEVREYIANALREGVHEVALSCYYSSA